MKKLGIEFYDRSDVVTIARELLGKILVTRFDGKLSSGRIVETEAYISLTDKASHSFGGKRTARNEDMYAGPGNSYVYICYGLHQMFNVVTNVAGIPDAVLIRAVEPISGISTMLKRSGKQHVDNTLTRGPGNVGRAMGISKAHSGLSLLDNKVFICQDDPEKFQLPESSIGSSRRIGVESAGASALLPYRFFIRGNPYVSGRPNR